MKALFCIHELAANGAVVALLRTGAYLVGQGVQVSVLVPHEADGVSLSLRPDFERCGLDVCTRIDPGDYDVAVGCTVAAQGFVLDMAGRLPILWWIHEGRAGVFDAAAAPARLDAFALADAIGFPTDAIMNRVWGAYLTPPIRAKSMVLPNIVPAPARGMSEPPRVDGRLRIICVGALCARKRQTDLITALEALDRPHVEALFVGTTAGDAHPLQALLAQKPQRYRWTPHAAPDDMAALYAGADLLVLPSADESFALAPLEAARSGTPSILTDLDCYDGLWRHGENALLYPVGDLDLLEGLLSVALAKPALRRRLAEAARPVAERFDAALSGPVFLAALRRLAR